MAVRRLRIKYPPNTPYSAIEEHLDSVSATQQYGDISAYQKLCIQMGLEEIKSAMDDDDRRMLLLKQYGVDIMLIIDLLRRDNPTQPPVVQRLAQKDVPAEVIAPAAQPTVTVPPVSPSPVRVIKPEVRPSVSIDADAVFDPSTPETARDGKPNWKNKLKGLAGSGTGSE